MSWPRGRACKLLVVIGFLAGGGAWLGSPRASAQAQTASAPAAAEALDCTSCHDQFPKFANSAHAKVGCTGCHTGIKEYPHPENLPKPACGNCHAQIVEQDAKSVHGAERAKGNAAPDCAMCHGDVHETLLARTAEYRLAIPDNCGMCHAEALTAFQESVHGKAVARGFVDAPVCTDCHGEHNIQRSVDRASQVSVGRQRDTCGRCHGDVRLAARFGIPADRLVSFDQSFHGLALRAGSQTVADCASCHGYHDILPSSDPRSAIHPTRLPETCGKCHPGAGTRFPITTIHLTVGGEEPTPVRWARVAYLIIIPFTLGFMFLHHLGDWIRKVFTFRLRPEAGAQAHAGAPHIFKAGKELVGTRTLGAYRMYPLERIQHGLLVISFAVLVWSGFALRYPDQFWSKPLLAWETSYPIRGIIHRTAGVLMIALSVMHVITLLVSPRLRKHWKELMPHRRDVVNFIENLSWRLFIRKERPRLPGHSYVEKIEYWAVVWGTAVMGITGVLLWANGFMLANFPKVYLDVARTIHFYEAVLATLAILIWHFYWVIFDPDVYPMDPAWLTGFSVRQRDEGHPEEGDLPPPEPAGKKKAREAAVKEVAEVTRQEQEKEDKPVLKENYGPSPQPGD